MSDKTNKFIRFVCVLFLIPTQNEQNKVNVNLCFNIIEKELFQKNDSHCFKVHRLCSSVEYSDPFSYCYLCGIQQLFHPTKWIKWYWNSGKF